MSDRVVVQNMRLHRSIDCHYVNGKIEVEDRYLGWLRQLIFSAITMNHRHLGVAHEYLFQRYFGRKTKELQQIEQLSKQRVQVNLCNGS